MKKILVIAFLLFTTTAAYGETWVCQRQNMTLVRAEGDCLKLGICTGENNAGLKSACIEATEQEYLAAGLPYKKIDHGIVSGNRIVDWTSQEVNDYLQAQSNAQAQAELDRIQSVEDKLETVDMSVVLTRADTATVTCRPEARRCGLRRAPSLCPVCTG